MGKWDQASRVVVSARGWWLRSRNVYLRHERAGKLRSKRCTVRPEAPTATCRGRGATGGRPTPARRHSAIHAAANASVLSSQGEDVARAGGTEYDKRSHRSLLNVYASKTNHHWTYALSASSIPTSHRCTRMWGPMMGRKLTTSTTRAFLRGQPCRDVQGERESLIVYGNPNLRMVTRV